MDTLVRVTVVVGSLVVAVGVMLAFVLLTLLSGFDTGIYLYWLLIPAVLLPLFVGALPFLALRGHRLAAGILAAIAWLIALFLGLSSWPVVALAPVAVAYALAATYLTFVRNVARASSSAPRDAGPPWANGPGPADS